MYRSGTIVAFTVMVFYCGMQPVFGSPFYNLGFEEAYINQSTQGFLVPASEALPFWTTNCDPVIYDTVPLGSTAVSIHDCFDEYFPPIEGDYSIILHSGWDDQAGSFADAYISQVGDIPGYARSVSFITDNLEGNLVLSLNGTVIPTFLRSTMGSQMMFAGDVSAYANTNAELRLELVNTDPNSSYPWASLDSIAFSNVVVPEPSTIVLLAAAALGSLAYAWRRRRQA